MKKLLFGLGAVLALTLTMGEASMTYAANCRELLIGKRYRCTFENESGTMSDDCIDFAAGTGNKFTRQSVDFPASLMDCTCTALGSPANPLFGASKDFLCKPASGDPFEEAITGKVNGNGSKIMKGQFFFSGTTNAGVYTCVEDATCD